MISIRLLQWTKGGIPFAEQTLEVKAPHGNRLAVWAHDRPKRGPCCGYSLARGGGLFISRPTGSYSQKQRLIGVAESACAKRHAIFIAHLHVIYARIAPYQA